MPSSTQANRKYQQINKEIQMLKVCFKTVLLNITISLSLSLGSERRRFLFEFESELTFQILHKNPLAYFNLTEILKFPTDNFASSFQ